MVRSAAGPPPDAGETSASAAAEASILRNSSVGHKVGAGAGGQIAALGQQFHGPAVDLPIAPDGGLHRLAGFGEGRRIQDNIVIIPALLLTGAGSAGQRRSRTGSPSSSQPVAPGVLRSHIDGGLGDVHTGDVLRTSQGGN